MDVTSEQSTITKAATTTTSTDSPVVSCVDSVSTLSSKLDSKGDSSSSSFASQSGLDSVPKNHSSTNFMKRATLNVGGRLFEIDTEELRGCFPHSLLGVMFSGRHTLKPNEKGHFYFNRNPNYFEPVLEFMRSGQVFINPSLNVEAIKEEAKYFGVYDEMFNSNEKLKFHRVVRKVLEPSSPKCTFHLGPNEQLRIERISGNGKLMINAYDSDGCLRISNAVVFDSSAFIIEPHSTYSSIHNLSTSGGYSGLSSDPSLTSSSSSSIGLGSSSSSVPLSSSQSSSSSQQASQSSSPQNDEDIHKGSVQLKVRYPPNYYYEFYLEGTPQSLLSTSSPHHLTPTHTATSFNECTR